MKKMLLTMMAALVLPALASAQTVDEIIARNIQAHGGMEKLKSVTSIRQTATLGGAFKAQIVEEIERPGKIRTEFIIQGMTQIEAYDGKVGWRVNPFGGRRDAERLSEDDTKDMVVDADIDGPLVDYQQKGHKAELMGHDSVEGTDCYKVKLTLKNGDIRVYYLDADSYLELKLETQTTVRGAIQEAERLYGDYDKVNGIYFPFALAYGGKDDPDPERITVDKVELNVPLDDSLFSMPSTKAPAKAAASGK